jgi:tRNA-specific 2-thiouridylase
VQAQVRYQQTAVGATVEALDERTGRVRVRFESPVSAVTPGQWLVLYRGDEVVGGGVIAAEGEE